MGCDIHCYAEKRGEHGMGTPHGADTTETVLHVDAATRLPDAGMPLQEGHHITLLSKPRLTLCAGHLAAG